MLPVIGSCVHTAGANGLLILVSEKVSVSSVVPLLPPYMISRLLTVSRMELANVRGTGATEFGVIWVQVGVPPMPLALLSAQTSFMGAPPASPPKIIMRLALTS